MGSECNNWSEFFWRTPSRHRCLRLGRVATLGDTVHSPLSHCHLLTHWPPIHLLTHLLQKPSSIKQRSRGGELLEQKPHKNPLYVASSKCSHPTSFSKLSFLCYNLFSKAVVNVTITVKSHILCFYLPNNNKNLSYHSHKSNQLFHGISGIKKKLPLTLESSL